MEHLEICFPDIFLGTTPLTMAVDDSKINLYCGILTLLMAGFYLAVREIRLIDKIRRLLLLVFLFFSFNMPVLGYVWHGFHDQYGIPNALRFCIFLHCLRWRMKDIVCW